MLNTLNNEIFNISKNKTKVDIIDSFKDKNFYSITMMLDDFLKQNKSLTFTEETNLQNMTNVLQKRCDNIDIKNCLKDNNDIKNLQQSIEILSIKLRNEQNEWTIFVKLLRKFFNNHIQSYLFDFELAECITLETINNYEKEKYVKIDWCNHFSVHYFLRVFS